MKFIINLAKNYIVVCKKMREKTNLLSQMKSMLNALLPL